MKMEIVFQDGRKETFDSIVSFNVTAEQTANEECHAPAGVQPPTEGKLFEVNPLGMDRSIFEKRRGNHKQERTRSDILEAFAEVDKNPEKYASAFYTLMPERNWNGFKDIPELEAYANDLGGVIVDWVEQALEWAQRISNGESWEDVCNKADTASWYRMILWKNGNYRFVGGSCLIKDDDPPSDVSTYDFTSKHRIAPVVPLVKIEK